MILSPQPPFCLRFILVSSSLYLTACSLAPETLPYSGEVRPAPELAAVPEKVVDTPPRESEIRTQPESPKAPVSIPVISRFDAKPGYYLQAGAFSSEENAQRMAREIAEATRGSVVVVRDQNDHGAVFFKPQAGPYPSLSAAVEGEAMLKKMGITKPRFIRRSKKKTQ